MDNSIYPVGNYIHHWVGSSFDIRRPNFPFMDGNSGFGKATGPSKRGGQQAFFSWTIATGQVAHVDTSGLVLVVSVTHHDLKTQLSISLEQEKCHGPVWVPPFFCTC